MTDSSIDVSSLNVFLATMLHSLNSLIGLYNGKEWVKVTLI